jgi:hypothetical protein
MPNLFYYHKTSLVHIFFGGGFGMNKFRKSACQSSVRTGIEYMASANVGLNCMENTILTLAIILIISKRSAR